MRPVADFDKMHCNATNPQPVAAIVHHKMLLAQMQHSGNLSSWSSQMLQVGSCKLLQHSLCRNARSLYAGSRRVEIANACDCSKFGHLHSAISACYQTSTYIFDNVAVISFSFLCHD